MARELPPTSSGTSQQERPNRWLDTGLVPLEERGPAEWLEEVQRWARFLKLEPNEGGPMESWEGFLNHPNQSSKEFLKDLLRHLHHPGAFDHDPIKSQALGRPHIVLLLVFLKSLAPAHRLFNQLPQKHLELYYRKVLGFAPRSAEPDSLHLIFQLQKNASATLIPHGALIDAGKDAEGHPLQYAVEGDLLVTPARITRLHTLFQDHRWLTFGEVARKVWGELPNPGDGSLLATYRAWIDQRDESQLPYLQDYLGLKSLESLFEIVREWPDQEARPPQSRLDISTLEHLYEERWRCEFQSRIERNAQWEKGLLAVWTKALEKKDVDTSSILLEWGAKFEGPSSSGKKLEKEEEAELRKATGMSAEEFEGMWQMKEKPLVAGSSVEREQVEKRRRRIVALLIKAMLRLKNKQLDGRELFRLRSISSQRELPLAPVEGAWPPFGQDQIGRKPARMGLVVASPILNLPDGHRIITLELGLGKGLTQLAPKILQLNGTPQLVGEEADKVIRLLLNQSLQFSLTTAKGNVRIKPNQGFPQLDRDQQKLTWQFSLKRNQPPIEVLGKPPVNAAFPTDQPALVIKLTPIADPNLEIHPYEFLKGLRLQSIRLATKVEDSRQFHLSNEKGIVNAKKPFLMFGREPAAGDNFFLSHPALCRPETNSVTLEIDWKGAPTDLGRYYQPYRRVQLAQPGSEDPLFVPGDQDPLQVPHVKVYAHSPARETPLETPLRLFAELKPEKEPLRIDGTEGITWSPTFPGQPAQNPAGTRQPFKDRPEDPTEWPSHLRFELQAPDLQHPAYSNLLTQRTNLLAAEMIQKASEISWSKVILPPPYSPQVRRLRFSYTAEIHQTFPVSKIKGLEIYHLEPFGYHKVTAVREGEKERWPLFAPIEAPGQLWIGLEELELPAVLSFLFQMEPGGEDHDGVLPEISWEYWRGNEWGELGANKILVDGTKGLRQSGIIQVKVPADAGHGEYSFPDNSYWLRLSVLSAANRFPYVRNISLQAARATLASDPIAAAHFHQDLPAQTVKGLLLRPDGIQSVEQPWPGQGRRPAETLPDLFTRIGERLRHKSRPVTHWDVERLVLDAFPQIYKAQCLSWRHLPTLAAGDLSLFIIPDVRGKVPDDEAAPPAPFADLALRSQVQDFLQPHCPPGSRLTVRNPDYVQLQVKAMVNFAAGRNPQYYLGELQRDLARLFSPWAFDPGGEIAVGGELHPNAVAEFIQERPYVDYVMFCNLIQLTKYGIQFANEGADPIPTGGFPVVFISAATHNLHIIAEDTDPADISLGIGWSQVGLDFSIS